MTSLGVEQLRKLGQIKVVFADQSALPPFLRTDDPPGFERLLRLLLMRQQPSLVLEGSSDAFGV
jgi:hypothetical protein